MGQHGTAWKDEKGQQQKEAEQQVVVDVGQHRSASETEEQVRAVAEQQLLKRHRRSSSHVMTDIYERASSGTDPVIS